MMKNNFTKTMCRLTVFIGLLLFSFTGTSQSTRIVESGGYLTALAKDNQGNLYAAKYNAGTGLYDIVKYNNGATSDVAIYGGLGFDAVDYVWGIAVDSHGNVFVAASNADNKVIKLTYNSGNNSYTPTVIMSGNYCSALTIDASDNLYTAEYNSGSEKYQIVRYGPNNYSAGTVLYNSIYLGSNYSYLIHCHCLEQRSLF